MASIPPYVAKGAAVGDKLRVKVKKLVWMTVGSGAVEALSDYEVDIAGKIKFLGYNDELTIRLQLLDNDPAALSGPCMLQLNTYTDKNAKYRATRDKLTVFAVLGGKKQNISISPANNGAQTECELFGHVNETVHLEPA